MQIINTYLESKLNIQIGDKYFVKKFSLKNKYLGQI